MGRKRAGPGSQQVQGEEEFPRLGLFKFDIMKFSASELLFLSEESSSGKPQPARPLVILLLLSFLSEADERLHLPEPPCAQPPHGDVHRFWPTGWCALCSLHAQQCGACSISPADSGAPREMGGAHGRPQINFYLSDKPKPCGICHLPRPPVSPLCILTSWAPAPGSSSQSQTVSLAFVSAPAASLSASSALATCYIVGRSSDVLSLTRPPRLDQVCFKTQLYLRLPPPSSPWPLSSAGDQQWQHRERPAIRDPAPEPTTPASTQRLAGHQRRAVQVS